MPRRWRGEISLSAAVSVDGTLTYRAGSDGAPYSAINQARGTYTRLPQVGDKVDCGDVLYRVDDRPVLLLCGAMPAYRDLHRCDIGKDVRQLNQNLHRLGYDLAVRVRIDPTDGDTAPRGPVNRNRTMILLTGVGVRLAGVHTWLLVATTVAFGSRRDQVSSSGSGASSGRGGSPSW